MESIVRSGEADCERGGTLIRVPRLMRRLHTQLCAVFLKWKFLIRPEFRTKPVTLPAESLWK